MKEDFEAAKARIMKRIEAARVWVDEAEYLLQCLDAQGRGGRKNSMIDVLLGFVGPKTERDKANENYWDAREELASACKEWDALFLR